MLQTAVPAADSMHTHLSLASIPGPACITVQEHIGMDIPADTMFAWAIVAGDIRHASTAAGHDLFCQVLLARC